MRIQAGFKNLPHSKQTFLYLDVISPQSGHTLRDPSSLVCGRSFGQRFLNHLVNEPKNMRGRVTTKRRFRFIYLPTSLSEVSHLFQGESEQFGSVFAICIMNHDERRHVRRKSAPRLIQNTLALRHADRLAGSALLYSRSPVTPIRSGRTGHF
jgi:hypothetical protein